MTKHESDDIPVVDKPTHSSGEKAPEIVVTQDMIEAGWDIVSRDGPQANAIREGWLIEAYLAMRRLEPLSGT